MDNLEPKKLALLRILQILEKYSDESHPLMQEDIGRLLEKDYGIIIERKAIGRNLSLLKEAGIEIESGRQGSWIVSRKFEDSELKMLIDGVLSSKHITERHSKELIEKLCELSNIYFRSHVKNVYSVGDWSKTDNCALFYNIEIIDEAIEKKRQIRFDYNRYSTDKKLHKSASHTVSPYQLILKNQRYYLMAYNEKKKSITYYRLDHITNIALLEEVWTELRTIDGFKNGINYKNIAAALPYPFADNVDTVEFLTDEGIVDHIIDCFGYDTRFEKTDTGKLKVTVHVSQIAMEYWAMQFINYVEVLSPQSLREKIKDNINKAIQKYN